MKFVDWKLDWKPMRLSISYNIPFQRLSLANVFIGLYFDWEVKYTILIMYTIMNESKRSFAENI